MIVKITNTATGFVWNRHGPLKQKPTAGNALTLYEDTGSNDQLFEMVYLGNTGFVYFALQSNPELVVNRHSITGDLMVWPLAKSTEADILFNTETVDGQVRLIMPHHEQYATAPNLFIGGNIETEANPEHNGTQFFQIVEVKAAGGPTTGSTEVPKATGKRLAVPHINQMAYPNGGTYCLAATLLGLCQYYGHSINMEGLINAGCVVRSNGYVNRPTPYVSWTRTGFNLGESAYCAAITEQVNQGLPVVVKMTAGGSDHYVTAVTGGATPDEVMVLDPMKNEATTLRAAFARKGQKYEHIRTTRKA